jgi:hypothetical protein
MTPGANDSREGGPALAASAGGRHVAGRHLGHPGSCERGRGRRALARARGAHGGRGRGDGLRHGGRGRGAGGEVQGRGGQPGTHGTGGQGPTAGPAGQHMVSARGGVGLELRCSSLVPALDSSPHATHVPAGTVSIRPLPRTVPLRAGSAGCEMVLPPQVGAESAYYGLLTTWGWHCKPRSRMGAARVRLQPLR